MKRTKLTALLLAVAILLTGCTGAGTAVVPPTGETEHATPTTSKTADEGLAAFGVELLRQTRKEGESTLVSPLSALLALSMAAGGAEGETLAELVDTMAGGVTLDELDANCASLLGDYLSLGGSTECNIANSLWTDEGFVPSPDFVARCQALYGAQVYETNLSGGKIVSLINDWVEEQTSGMIDGILNKPLSDSAVLMLVNALYLKNRWQNEFDGRHTREGEFFPKTGTPVSVEFMGNGIRTERYITTESEVGVVLPYDDGRLAFVALMPRAGGVGDYVEGWEGARLATLLAGAADTRLSLGLPKFTAEWGGSLNEMLKAMGIETAFQPDGADFSALGTSDRGNEFFISDVIHKTRMEVNEEGTEAAAVTAVIVEAGGAPMVEEYETLILDRPFVYGIVDLERNIPLFLGTFEGA